MFRGCWTPPRAVFLDRCSVGAEAVIQSHSTGSSNLVDRDFVGLTRTLKLDGKVRADAPALHVRPGFNLEGVVSIKAVQRQPIVAVGTDVPAPGGGAGASGI